MYKIEDVQIQDLGKVGEVTITKDDCLLMKVTDIPAHPVACRGRTGKESIQWLFCVSAALCFWLSVYCGWLGSRVVSVLDSGAEGPGFKSQPQHCRVTVLGKLFTPIVPLFTKQRNW